MYPDDAPVACDATKPDIPRSPLCRRKTLRQLSLCDVRALLFQTTAHDTHSIFLNSLNARDKLRKYWKYHTSQVPHITMLSQGAFGDELDRVGTRRSQPYSVRRPRGCCDSVLNPFSFLFSVFPRKHEPCICMTQTCHDLDPFALQPVNLTRTRSVRHVPCFSLEQPR